MIHKAAIWILGEVGFAVEHGGVLKRLADFGACVDFSTQRVYFPCNFVEAFLKNSERFEWENSDFISAIVFPL
ncbi:MAG: hypothetical protein NZ937_04365 [Armatimonadetes bacterium]|nr:hypothetical protein [Armatimonadota bacterium]